MGKIIKCKCNVCELEFTAEKVVIAQHSKGDDIKGCSYFDSKDGRLFGTHWFCNACWEEILAPFKDKIGFITAEELSK